MRKCFTQPPEASRTQKAIVYFVAFLIGATVHQAAQAAPVPDFRLQLLDGKTISLHEYRGRPVLINFFYSK